MSGGEGGGGDRWTSWEPGNPVTDNSSVYMCAEGDQLEIRVFNGTMQETQPDKQLTLRGANSNGTVGGRLPLYPGGPVTSGASILRYTYWIDFPYRVPTLPASATGVAILGSGQSILNAVYWRKKIIPAVAA